jgi:hypothetical protein
MSENAARIRFKVGQFEVEYDGHPAFLKDDLIHLLEKVTTLYARHQTSLCADPVVGAASASVNGTARSSFSYTTGTIAARLNASTGPELAIAASAKLSLVDGKDRFLRKEIHDEMKAATTYYNSNMTGNLPKSLEGLVKNKRLNEVAKDTYALSASEKRSVEITLAQYS